MAQANVGTTLNVYTQVLDGSVRAAVEKSATNCSQLFWPEKADVVTD